MCAARFYDFRKLGVKSVALLALLAGSALALPAQELETRLETARADEERLAVLTAWFEEGRFGEVEDAFASGRVRAEANPRMLNLWGLAVAAQERWADAIALFERAIQRAPERPEAHLNLAVALTGVGARGRALAEFERAARLDPSSVEARLGWARIARELRRPAQAVPALEEALALAPADPRVLVERARVAEVVATTAADTALALDRWQQVELSQPTVESARALGRLSRASDPERAIAAFFQCAERDSAAVDCAEAGAAVAFSRARFDQGVEILRPRLRMLSESGLLLLLRSLQELGDAQGVEEVLTRREPASVAAWGTVALVRRQAGNLAAALGACNAALALAEEDPDLYNLWGVLLSESGDPTGAVKAWRRALEIDPDHSEARENLAAHPRRER